MAEIVSKLTIGDLINIAAMAVTIVCTVITIILSAQVNATRKIIEKKYRKLSLIEVRSNLEEMVRHGNELRIRLSTGGRGQSITSLTLPIHSALSAAMGRLAPTCDETDLRDLVLLATQRLKIVETCAVQDRQSNHENFMEAVHDAVGTCRQYFEAADSKEV